MPFDANGSSGEVRSVFCEAFGRNPRHIVTVPGRVELLGNHTDYNGGLVLALPIDRVTEVAIASRTDGRVRIVSSAFRADATFFVGDFEKKSEAGWADYAKGVLWQLWKRKVHFTGFDAAIHSTIPMGIGLSSSAALQLAVALAVRELFPFRLTECGLAPAPGRDRSGRVQELTQPEKLALARLCLAAERDFVGVQCGLLDYLAGLHGKLSEVLLIDCLHETVERLPMVGGVALVICESGVRHELRETGYNQVQEHCLAAAKRLGIAWLRHATVEDVENGRSQLSAREYECAMHVASENRRVVFAERALREGDVIQLGAYLLQSHASSRDYLKNSCWELDLLVELAAQTPGCRGARLTGGGFGGATVNLVDAHQIETFIGSMAEKYQIRTGRVLRPMRCPLWRV